MGATQVSPNYNIIEVSAKHRFNSGNNTFNAISIWKIDEQANEEKTLRENNKVISELQEKAPRYHTYAMRINYLCTCDLLLPKAKSSSIRAIYRMLMGDVSAAENTNEAKVEECVKIALDLSDPEITINLHEHSCERPTVDECRHNPIVHLATAISMNNFLRQIEHGCPSGTLIQNNKYRYKVEKPGFPVVAIERGK
ncbi:hypothetical protein C2G38_2205934 [Gigaspora rosea]|uniref:Uncharacterized protein n=1 Tax=Gigaspora rosea TaxID=44941 RepID=A0A397UP71_9GLOM|nr:hypothetical protein C2G38_2205934 [Gigaspora rosea]